MVGVKESYSGPLGGLVGEDGSATQRMVRAMALYCGSDDTVDEDEYMQRYQNITRRYIGRVTSSLESEYQITVTLMREIANIADIVSTEGLDSYNRELVDQVRNIVHKCLTEQFEDLPNDKMRKKGSQKRRQKDCLTTKYE